MKIIKNLLATIGVVVFILILFGLVKILSYVPLETIIRFLKGNWGGMLIGVALSHLAMVLIPLFSKKKRRRRMEDDEE